MQSENDWESLRGPRADRLTGRISPVRVALLFGSAAIALALVATSYLGDIDYEDMAAIGNPGIDAMATGAVRGQSRTYTIRKSILQSSSDSVCIIRPNGSSSGEC